MQKGARDCPRGDASIRRAGQARSGRSAGPGLVEPVPLTATISYMRLLIVLTLVTAAGAFAASADLKDAQGKSVGTLTIKPAKDGVRITGQLQGLPDGMHALHIHETGTC